MPKPRACGSRLRCLPGRSRSALARARQRPAITDSWAVRPRVSTQREERAVQVPARALARGRRPGALGKLADSHCDVQDRCISCTRSTTAHTSTAMHSLQLALLVHCCHSALHRVGELHLHPGVMTHTPECPTCSAATLNDSGTELWVVTESNTPGGVSISGYTRRSAVSAAPEGTEEAETDVWRLRHSLGGSIRFSASAASRPLRVHLVRAPWALILISPHGHVAVQSVAEPSTPPFLFQMVRRTLQRQSPRATVCLCCSATARDTCNAPCASGGVHTAARSRIQAQGSVLGVQEGFHPDKSSATVQHMSSAHHPAPRGVLMHVRLHVSQQSLAIERYVIAHSTGGACKAVRLKVRIVAPLAPLWRQCVAPQSQGKPVTPSAVLDCCWVRGATAPQAPGESDEDATQAAAAAPRGDGMLVALNTRILKLEPVSGSSQRGRQDLMGVQKEKWRARVLDLPVTIVPPPPSKTSPGARTQAHMSTRAFLIACGSQRQQAQNSKHEQCKPWD